MIFNIDSGTRGEDLVITAPAGVNVTVSKGNRSRTKISDSNGYTMFKGLTNGEWTINISDGTQVATKTIFIGTDYSTSITFFSATISVTYPAGSTCTCTDGITTFTASDTSGNYDFVVPNTGDWTLTATDGDKTVTHVISITSNGQAENVGIAYKQYLYKNGNQYTDITGGWGVNTHPGGCNITESGIEFHDTLQTLAGSVVFTNNTIDVTTYNKAIIKFRLAEIGYQVGGYVTVGLKTDPVVDYVPELVCSATTTYTTATLPVLPLDHTLEVDISAVTGLQYVVIKTMYATCIVTEILLT